MVLPLLSRDNLSGSYPASAVERAMKVEDVLLRATAGKIIWWQAAETIGISDRQIEPVGWRGTMARLQVIAPHLDATITLTIGTRRVRGYCVEGMLFRI